jgi:hypothetical protein
MDAITRSDSGPRRSTLLALVWELQNDTNSADEVAVTAAQLVNDGRVVLTGNFRGCRLELQESASAV